MISFRISLINLLWLGLILSEDHGGLYTDTVWQPAKPHISHLQANSDKQSLVVSWLVNHSRSVGDGYEIQISRTENHTIIYSKNISSSAVDSVNHTWTWTSDLPLECVDHSVRIRHFYNQYVPSPWSSWMTNYGVQAHNKTKIFPTQRVLKEGSSAMFCCVPPTGVNITSIAFNNRKYPLISIGPRVKAITVDKLTRAKTDIKAFLLSCNGATGISAGAWNYVSCPPQKPSNLSCSTADLTTVTCTWDLDKNREPDDGNEQNHTLHIENSNEAPIKCKESSCTFRAVPQLQEYSIRVVVKDQLGEETESYSFNISDRVSPVVELDRVCPGVMDTTVSWTIQGNLTHLNPICQVTADPNITTELSCSNVSSFCKVKLEHLLPNTCYSVRVRCSVNAKFWGEWTQSVPFMTYPHVTLDIWRTMKQLSDPNSRQVTLLWTPRYSGSASTVNIQRYKLQWSQEGQDWTEQKVSERTQAEVQIGPGQYDFTVQAVLHAGSTIPAHITIPQRDDGENIPVEKLLSRSTAAGISLSWEKQDTAICGYTIEWCTLGNAHPCTLQWMNVPVETSTLFLPARNFKAGCRYTFNIYGCTKNGHTLLEKQTGYIQELNSVEPPSLVELVESASSSVTLEWNYNEDDPAHPAFITGYLVSVHKDGSHSLPGPAAMFNVSVEDPRRKSVTIDGLQQDQEYEFSVSALTHEGPGQPASIILRTRADYTVHLATILTPLLLLLGCTILLWPQRKTLKSLLKHTFAYPAGMNIKSPELDSFLHETVEKLQSQKTEECISCEIEILNTRPPLNVKTIPRDPEDLPAPGSHPPLSTLPLSCVLLPTDYCPQSVTFLQDRTDLQQTVCVANKVYFHCMEEELSEEQVLFGDISDPSEQDSCGVIYGYVSNDISNNV